MFGTSLSTIGSAEAAPRWPMPTGLRNSAWPSGGVPPKARSHTIGMVRNGRGSLNPPAARARSPVTVSTLAIGPAFSPTRTSRAGRPPGA